MLKINRRERRRGEMADANGLKIGCGSPSELFPSRGCANTREHERPSQTLRRSTLRQPTHSTRAPRVACVGRIPTQRVLRYGRENIAPV